MIIFYRKTNGEIVGTIEGRMHNPDQLEMWLGSRDEIDRIVVQWRPIREEPINDDDYEPVTTQQDLYRTIDKDTKILKNYKVDVSTGMLLPINSGK